MDYTTRVGAGVLPAPSSDPCSLPTVSAPDDGLIIVSAGHSPTCADCGRGTLQWAEAGYVPWHRVCDVCGSHWDLHPVTYFGREVGGRIEWMGTDGHGRIRPIAQLDPDRTLPGTTNAELLQLAIDAGAVHPNGTSTEEHVASVCWAQRARFYAR